MDLQLMGLSDIITVGLVLVVVIAGAQLALPALKMRLVDRRSMAVCQAIVTSAPTMPVQQLTSLSRMSGRAQFAALASVVTHRMSSTDGVIRAQASAREKLDATELSLRRLVDDMGDVMPPVVMTSLEPTDAKNRATSTASANAA